VTSSVAYDNADTQSHEDLGPRTGWTVGLVTCFREILLEKSSWWEAVPFGRSSPMASEADLTYHQGTIPVSSRLWENELDR
jgi:hypothetical protein